jgi:acyl carrier protein
MNEKIKSIMGAVFGIDPKTISNDASIENVEQWDSLKHISLVIALEQEFGIVFTDKEIAEIISFKQLKECISSK